MLARQTSQTVVQGGTLTTYVADWTPSATNTDGSSANDQLLVTLPAGATITTAAASRQASALPTGPSRVNVYNPTSGASLIVGHIPDGTNPANFALAGAPVESQSGSLAVDLHINTPAGFLPPDVDVRLQFVVATAGAGTATTPGVTGAAVNSAGHLIITYSNSSTYDAGNVGPSGNGVKSAIVDVQSGDLFLNYQSGSDINLGPALGNGSVGTVAAAVNGQGHLILYLSNGNQVDAGRVDGLGGSGPKASWNDTVYGTLTANGLVAVWPVDGDVSLPAGGAAFSGVAMIPAGSTATNVVASAHHSGTVTTLGTLTFAAGAYEATVSSSGTAAVSLVPGDFISLAAGSSVDGTLANFGFRCTANLAF
jgi:hypothetical protein